MFEGVTLQDLRKQMEEHLLIVEEVLGGIDLYVQQLEGRLARVEEALGLEPEGLSASGALAGLQRMQADLARLRQP